jgi:hypothetical protein
MANIASCDIMAIFLEGTDRSVKESFLKEFTETQVYDSIYNEPENELDDNAINILYGARWSEDQIGLQKLCDKYNCRIIGVCTEWGCLYVNSFELNSLFETIANHVQYENSKLIKEEN